MGTRVATAADLDAVMALEHASFPTDAWSPAMMREELASPHGWYIVVEEAGRLIGYAGLRAVRGARDADVQTITISEAARGRGRGRALLGELLGEAVRRGVHDVFLEVRADNPAAQTLYLSEGFAEVGRRPRYYQPDDVDALVMQLDLRGWAARRAEAAPSGASAQVPEPASAQVREPASAQVAKPAAAQVPEPVEGTATPAAPPTAQVLEPASAQVAKPAAAQAPEPVEGTGTPVSPTTTGKGWC